MLCLTHDSVISGVFLKAGTCIVGSSDRGATSSEDALRMHAAIAATLR